MNTWTLGPCPLGCPEQHYRLRVRASRTRLDDSAASWGTARDRVESEASEPLSAVAPAAKPMPTSRRMRSRREAARSASGGHSLGER